MKDKSTLYSILHIEDNCIETIASYTNRTKATSYFRKLLKDSFPQLKTKDLDIVVDEGILITHRGDTYNFIEHTKA
jgi:hypothetical protein